MIYEFSDYDGNKVIIDLRQIEQIRRPSGRVHDHGGVILVSGRYVGFSSDSEAMRMAAAWEQLPR